MSIWEPWYLDAEEPQTVQDDIRMMAWWLSERTYASACSFDRCGICGGADPEHLYGFGSIPGGSSPAWAQHVQERLGRRNKDTIFHIVLA